MTAEPGPTTYEALQATVMARLGDGAYAEGLRALDAHGHRFPADAANVRYLRACLLARSGQPSEAIESLRADHDEGLWYSERLLLESPSLQSLRGDPAYEALVDDYRHRPPAEAAADTPAVAIPAESAAGLLLAVHGNGQTARHALDAWRFLADDGWAVAAPFSSQMLHSAAAVWDDMEIAVADVERQVRRLPELVPDPSPSIVAGFSLGADVALATVLSGLVRSKRVLMIGPPALLPRSDGWAEALRAAPGIQAHVVLGGEDEAVSHDDVSAMVDALRAAGSQVELERIPGLGHDYPPRDHRRALVQRLVGVHATM